MYLGAYYLPGSRLCALITITRKANNTHKEVASNRRECRSQREYSSLSYLWQIKKYYG